MRTLLALVLVAACAVLSAAAPAPEKPDLRRLLAPAPAPALADYRLFQDPAGLKPSAGVIAYDLGVPLFSDYAQKSRYVFVPPGAKARANGAGVLEFPVGTTLIKTFAFPADFRKPDAAVKRIETRLLVRKADGWRASTYVWNEVGDAATLLEVGAQTPVSFIDAEGRTQSFVYDIPNRNQCKECHNLDGVLTPIGPKPRNLNHAVSFDGAPENQLARWVRAGILEESDGARQMESTLDSRARAYLDANCAHCHNPKGSANNSGLDLSYEQTAPDRFGVGKRPVAAGRASAGFLFDIDPGHPERSILLHRLASTDPGVMMPEVGRSIVHKEGVALIREWVAAMPANQNQNIPGGTP